MISESTVEQVERGKKSQDFRFLEQRKWLSNFQGLRVLDLGCGNGLYSKELHDIGAQVFALDINMHSVELTKNYVGATSLIACCANSINLPFRNSVFDCIICIETLSHIPHKAQNFAISEMFRVLKDEGKLIISVHNKTRFALQNVIRFKKPLSIYKNPGLTIFPLSKDELANSLNKAGFKSINKHAFLNFYNSFHQKHPKLFPFLSILETILSQTPLLNRASLTILSKLVK